MSSTFERHQSGILQKKPLFLQFDCIYLFIYLFKYLLMEHHMFTWARVKVKRHVSALREAPAATWRLETANWKWKGQPGNSERHAFTWGGDFSGCLRVGSTVLQLELSCSEVANLRSEWVILKNAVSTVFSHNPKVFFPPPFPREPCSAAPHPDLGCTSHEILGGRITGRARFSRKPGRIKQHQERYEVNL